MARNLADRLQEKLSEQVAEISAMTDSELKRLSEHVTRSVTDELNEIEIAIVQSKHGIMGEIPQLKWIVTATWAALIVSLLLMSYSLWHSIQPRPVQVLPDGVQSFMRDGREYLIVPDGIEPKSCRLAEGGEVMCLLLPENGNGG